MAELLPKCLCGSLVAEASIVNGIEVLTCECGVVRQRVRMTPEAYAAFYTKDYYRGVYTHDDGQDKATAAKRVAAHKTYLRGRILDIGSGTGAFVSACRENGSEAWGQDIAPVGPKDFTYYGELADQHFPTSWVQTITLHDVLEHMLDPHSALTEIARILAPGGSLIVDFPAFNDPAGRHHWKPREHLWLLTREQLCALLEEHGFRCVNFSQPIPGKIVVYASRKAEKRPRILVPPGIGDIYWVMVKLRGFLANHNLAIPEIWIDAPTDRKRSIDYVRRIPFVKAGGYHNHPGMTPAQASAPLAGWKRRRGLHLDPARREAYHDDARNAFQGVDGFDWFLSVNGSMNAGRSLEQIMPECQTDWDIPMFVSLAERAYGEALRSAYGPYVVTSFFSEGQYGRWLMEMPPAEIYGVLRDIHGFGLRVVLTGAKWDRYSKINTALRELDRDGILIDLVGETTIEQFFGAVRGASGCIGFPAGNTIMSAAFGRPTVIIWNDVYNRAMHRNACPNLPTYRPVNTALHDRKAVVSAFESVLLSPSVAAAAI